MYSPTSSLWRTTAACTQSTYEPYPVVSGMFITSKRTSGSSTSSGSGTCLTRASRSVRYVMFRYSRDVKRCGPGTKAGAPVGVVYCLSTSSFFILPLTLELDVSTFGIGDALATYWWRSAPAASTDLWAGHGKPDHCEITGHLSETCRANILPRCSRACSCPPPMRGGRRLSGLLGLDGRPPC